jgi:hypothetical protein
MVLTLALIFLSSPMISAQQVIGMLEGFAADEQYARVVSATIIFENSSFRKEVETNREGAYKVELPAGTYRVRVQSTGFYSRRFKFTVEPNVVKTLNVTLYLHPPVPIKWTCPKLLRPCIIE